MYHYIYYRMYIDMCKTNRFSAENSASKFLSLCLLLNIITIYFFSENLFNESGYIYFIMTGLTLSFLNAIYFDDKKHKSIIWEFRNNKILKFWNYLIVLYPLLSFLLLSISLEFSLTSLTIIILGFLFLRALIYFSDL